MKEKKLNKKQINAFKKAKKKFDSLDNTWEKINFEYDNIQLKHIPCGKTIISTTKTFNKKTFSCGHKTCKTNKIKQTKLKKYGDENFNNIDKYKRTIKEKYGVENVSQINDIKEKKENTCLKNWGTKSHFQAEKIKNNIKNTCEKKYDKKYFFQTKKFKEKFKETMLKKYGAEHPSQSKIIINKRLKNYYKNKIKKFNHVKPLFTKEEYRGAKDDSYIKYRWLCKKCNNKFEYSIADGQIPVCRICNPIITGTSKIEKELQNWIKTLNIKSKNNKRFYYNNNKNYYELDVFFPEKNIGIEMNGLYWHSELQGKNKYYHINKTNFFKELNINIIQIFENEWVLKQDIVKSIIKSKLNIITNNIYARQCNIKKISNKESKIFLNENHLQGEVNGSIKIGLFHKNKLVSLMIFCRSRFNKKYKYELLRFCNLINTNIVGGFSKLLKYFTKNYSKSIISYCDLRYSSGKVYLKNNFKFIRISKPNYFYFKNNEINLQNRLQFQKHKLNNKLKFFNENLTEWENMQINGYNKIWDCGNIVFEYKKEKDK